ncbi:MAG: hypothetical protein JWO83_4749 [Caulobacteraceae bacterium]|nr:hypothetical protein [Caulobacteraceae bacterium]
MAIAAILEWDAMASALPHEVAPGKADKRGLGSKVTAKGVPPTLAARAGDVAEPVDAADLKSVGRKAVRVRVPPSPPVVIVEFSGGSGLPFALRTFMAVLRGLTRRSLRMIRMESPEQRSSPL